MFVVQIKKICVYNSGMYCSDEQLIFHDFSMIYSLMSLFSDIDKAPFFLLEETLKKIITIVFFIHILNAYLTSIMAMM